MYKIKSISDETKFFETLENCDMVFFITDDGNRISLKSKIMPLLKENNALNENALGGVYIQFLNQEDDDALKPYLVIDNSWEDAITNRYERKGAIPDPQPISE